MNYKDTVFLPRTEFPMRAGLPKREPEILQKWKDIDIYARLRAARQNAEPFILHDGPPYANGQLHIGHALNKILKDVINRSQSMLGKNANYVPGWDCHGLPIEWKIEEQYRKKGKTRIRFQLTSFGRSVVTSRRIGWTSNQRNSSGLAFLATGTTLTPPWPMTLRRQSLLSLEKS